jgi:hypothetical protein
MDGTDGSVTTQQLNTLKLICRQNQRAQRRVFGHQPSARLRRQQPSGIAGLVRLDGGDFERGTCRRLRSHLHSG